MAPIYRRDLRSVHRHLQPVDIYPGSIDNLSMSFMLHVFFLLYVPFSDGSLSEAALDKVTLNKTADLEWWQKPEIQKRIREERAVILSIKKQGEGSQSFYNMTGAGIVKASPPYVLKKILSFPELEKVSEHFKKVTHQPEYNRVYFLLEAYGYQARLLIKYEVIEKDDRTVFLWNVVWGGFQGMIGRVELTNLGANKTQAILISRFEDKEIPIPQIFKGFVLEIIVQHVAKNMRAWIEESAEKEAAKEGRSQ